MKRELLRVSIRKNAIVIPEKKLLEQPESKIIPTTATLIANCYQLGFTFSQELVLKLNAISPREKLGLLNILKDIKGVNKNWTPLVKQWDIPTEEEWEDHLITFFANIFKFKKGTNLPCGHLIPKSTFPLNRYNGCPYCGTPFEFEKLDYEVGSNKLKVLEWWSEEDLLNYFKSLLESPVALDATQADSLKILLKHLALPESVNIQMKETLMMTIDILIDHEKAIEAGKLFKTPNDVLRYLWYKHTGYLQIIEPKVISTRMAQNAQNLYRRMDERVKTSVQAKQDLKLKFNRASCKQYAIWLNSLPMNVSAQCENMHPKRGIWIRVIRALRLAEYSKKKGFERLAKLLDVFYNQDYEVWQGKVNQYKMSANSAETFRLLKQRPGVFARSLFSNMLWFGAEETLTHFREIIDKIPSRLIFTLNMYAENYFQQGNARTVKPLGGISRRIVPNVMLSLYNQAELNKMRASIQDLSLEVIKNNLGQVKNTNQTIFIDTELDLIPIAIGDRSEHLQDSGGALMGSRFKVEGSTVRLFMQWGEGLPAQHLDMDLSCRVAYNKREDYCSYSKLTIFGCRHSGDIQKIPAQVGTAEYIDIDLDRLSKAGAKYVSFTCNAYTNGSLVPNLVVGWMNSKHRMKISSKGVAYNPTQVQHQIRIQKSLTKGMVFGVLDIEKREIIWLEMGFGGQVVQNLSRAAIEGLLNKLDSKLKIGDLLRLKAEVQQLTIVDDFEKADEVYDAQWAQNTAEVSRLFMG